MSECGVGRGRRSSSSGSDIERSSEVLGRFGRWALSCDVGLVGREGDYQLFTSFESFAFFGGVLLGEEKNEKDWVESGDASEENGRLRLATSPLSPSSPPHAKIPLTFVIPPSTTKSVPLTKLLSSLARNTTAWAISIASPKRPVGKWT